MEEKPVFRAFHKKTPVEATGVFSNNSHFLWPSSGYSDLLQIQKNKGGPIGKLKDICHRSRCFFDFGFA